MKTAAKGLRLVPELQVEPPPSLEPDSFAETLYTALAPLAGEDEQNGWGLLILCNAIGTMFQQVEELVRDTPDGPGWSMLLDLERCPPEALPWLGQLVGVRIPPGTSEANARAIIDTRSGWTRGTPSAIKSAAAATLTGSKTVLLRERDPSGADPPYTLGVVTYTSETPDAAATLKALREAKPAGLVLVHSVLPGQDWLAVRTANTNWQAVKTKYADWSAVMTDKPT